MLKRILILFLAALTLAPAALAETWQGKTVAAAILPVRAEADVTLSEVRVEVGMPVAQGETLAALQTAKVFASEDGVIARILAREGDPLDGAALEIAPTSRYTVYCTVKGAADSPSAMRIRAGETLYLRCTADGSHRALGVVSRIDGSEYRLETTGGELYVGETVSLYRDADFSADQCVGKGTVVSAEVQSIAATGTLQRLCVQEGESVERGELLFETCAAQEPFLVAPADGLVVQAAAAGDALRSGETAFAVAPFDQLRVEIQVDETAVSRLRAGDSVSLVYAWDMEETPRGGTVETISRQAENDLYTVRIRPDEAIDRIGLSVSVRIPDEA